MIKSVRLKLTFWYIGSITSLLLLFGLIVYFSLKTILNGNLDKLLYNGGKILERSFSEYMLQHADDPHSLYTIEAGEKTFFIDNIDNEARENFFVDTVYIQLLTFPKAEKISYSIIARTSSLKNRLLPLSPYAYKSCMSHTSFFETLPHLFSFPVRMISLPVYDKDNHSYILQIALSMQHVNNTLEELFFVFCVSFPLVLIVVAGIGHVFMKQAFSPIRRMVAVTRNITSEDLSLRLDPVDSHDEIGELADTLNAMIDRLEQSFQQMTQFSGDVSHELKTPLAQLKCNAEIALRKPRTSGEYQQALRNTIEDTDQLQTIIDDLLFLTKIDSKSWSSSFITVALHEVFLDVFETMYGLVQQKRLAIKFETMDAVLIPGDRGLLRRMFINLISNAIQYTPSGGVIVLSLRKAGHQAVLTITDSGIGIPEAALPHIFDRLYRVDPSRSNDTGGSGLGLAIVDTIVARHNGKILVNSTPGHGTIFQVSFPCFQ
ncbi:MAG: HAMP domain-containing protein [Deltaproteobacteria bacterium]|nr:HAMP domain-containing protein [Deltaproteobacteria bacterium]